MPAAASIAPADVLQNAIQSTDLDRLRRVIQTLCNEIPDVKRVLTRELIVEIASDDSNDSEDSQGSDEEGEEEGEEAGAAAPRGVKRQRARYALCLNCREEFDVSANGRNDCEYHDGDLEPDDDFFADHDDDGHGDRDGDFCKEEYPEGYIWTCCDEVGIDTDGCKTGRHKEDMNYMPGSKKPKIWE